MNTINLFFILFMIASASASVSSLRSQKTKTETDETSQINIGIKCKTLSCNGNGIMSGSCSRLSNFGGPVAQVDSTLDLDTCLAFKNGKITYDQKGKGSFKKHCKKCLMTNEKTKDITLTCHCSKDLKVAHVVKLADIATSYTGELKCPTDYSNWSW